MKNSDKKILDAEKIMVILKKHGEIVSLEEAVLIAEFVNTVTNITVNQYIRENH